MPEPPESSVSVLESHRRKVPVPVRSEWTMPEPPESSVSVLESHRMCCCFAGYPRLAVCGRRGLTTAKKSKSPMCCCFAGYPRLAVCGRRGLTTAKKSKSPMCCCLQAGSLFGNGGNGGAGAAGTNGSAGGAGGAGGILVRQRRQRRGRCGRHQRQRGRRRWGRRDPAMGSDRTRSRSARRPCPPSPRRTALPSRRPWARTAPDHDPRVALAHRRRAGRRCHPDGHGLGDHDGRRHLRHRRGAGVPSIEEDVVRAARPTTTVADIFATDGEQEFRVSRRTWCARHGRPRRCSGQCRGRRDRGSPSPLSRQGAIRW